MNIWSSAVLSSVEGLQVRAKNLHHGEFNYLTKGNK